MLPFFEWCEASALGQLVRTSLWMFPVIEAVHLLSLCVLGGALLTVDLRMLGLGMTGTPIPVLARGARPWLVRALMVQVATGILLFMSEAVKCYHNPSFWVKMSTLPIALLFTFTLRQRVALRASAGTTWLTRVTAVASIGLWFTVAAAGRWIGFSS